MNRLSKMFLFFSGWMLSPFTWWNDAFINIPVSYLIANLLFYIIQVPFVWLVVGAYWLTNIIGLLVMYFSGRDLLASTRNKPRFVICMILFVTIYSAAMFCLDRCGKLLPIPELFNRYHGMK